MTRLITDVLRDYRNGQLVHAATDALDELLAAVQKTRKSGELTLKLKVSPEAGSANGVEVVADMAVKAPRPTLPKAVFFIGPEGGLFRNDPGQTEMFEERTDPVTGEVTERPRLRDASGG